MQFSANLGFLWKDLPLPDAIRAAKAAGFDAVECHWPFDVPTDDVNHALADTRLQMLGINAPFGDVASGEFGLTALPGRELDARRAIDQAVAYASQIGAQNVHVIAGVASGRSARETYISNLRYAAHAAAAHNVTILIEPLNKYDNPGYFLSTTTQAAEIIEEVSAPNLKLMFDCYHVQIMEGDVTRRLTQLLPIIGHMQVAAVPDRGEPDDGELNYRYVFAHIASLGYTRPIGAEYRPRTTVEEGLGWLSLDR